MAKVPQTLLLARRDSHTAVSRRTQGKIQNLRQLTWRYKCYTWMPMPILALFLLVVTGCSAPAPHSEPQAFEFGFWHWDYGAKPQKDSPPLDVLYFRGGEIPTTPWQGDMGGGYFPRSVPRAKAYWMVLRYDGRDVPSGQSIAAVVAASKRAQAQAKELGLTLRGVQLDIDCPTGELRQYTAYLREARKRLPGELQLSITALLDWFRPRTDIAEVIAAVDEFVPQFYDLHDPGSLSQSGGPPTPGAPVEAAKWKEPFSRFGKPFRIGVSTFGRVRSWTTSSRRFYIYGDVSPLELGLNPALTSEVRTTPAGEVAVRYTASRPGKVGYMEFSEDVRFDVTLATPDSIARAVAEVRKMGGLCRGVLFFRWPAPSESTAMPSRDVLSAAGVLDGPVEPKNRLQVREAGCAAVFCADLRITDVDALRATSTRVSIRSSGPFLYYLPDKAVPARLAGPGRIELRLPAYPGHSPVPLGRVVADAPVQLQLSEEQ